MQTSNNERFDFINPLRADFSFAQNQVEMSCLKEKKNQKLCERIRMAVTIDSIYTRRK